MLRGDLSLMPIEDLLDWMGRRKVAGVISVESSGAMRRLGVSSGKVLWAASSRPEEQSGQVLLASELIDEASLADALDVSSETQVPLGKILMMVGAIDEETMVTVLAAKIRETVTELFALPEGPFEVEPRAVSVVGVDAGLAIDTCLNVGRRRAPRWEAIRQAIPSDDHRFLVSGSDQVPKHTGEIDGAKLWRLVGEGKSGGVIASAFGGDRYTAYDQLARWISDGALRLDRRLHPRQESGSELAAGARARLRGGDRAGALTMAERAMRAAPTDPEVRRAYAEAERSRVAEVARTLLLRHRVPRLRCTREEIAAMEISDGERRLLQRIDGRWDLVSLLRGGQLRESEALLALARFAEQGVVELG